MIINVEAQKENPTEYDIIKRAVFYASRLISAQKEAEFSGSDYNGIRKVYTIWLCMRAPEHEGSSITSYTLHEKQLFGHHVEPKEHYDLINITLIYLGNHRTGDNLIELLRLERQGGSEERALGEAIRFEFDRRYGRGDEYDVQSQRGYF